MGVVGEGGKAVAGGFGEADVAGDDGVEEQVAEVLFELFADFDDEAAAAVVHGAGDAGYIRSGLMAWRILRTVATRSEIPSRA